MEDTDGYGLCVKQYPGNMTRCCDLCNNDMFVGRDYVRHSLALLLRSKRYWLDNHLPSIYMHPGPIDYSKTLDFAIDYIRTFGCL